MICLLSRSTTAFLMLCSVIVHPFLPSSSNGCTIPAEMPSDSSIWPYPISFKPLAHPVSIIINTRMRGIATFKMSMRNQIYVEVMLSTIVILSSFYLLAGCSNAMRWSSNYSFIGRQNWITYMLNWKKYLHMKFSCNQITTSWCFNFYTLGYVF